MSEAKTEMDKALAVGIRTAASFYHAGTIAAAAGDATAARKYWEQSLSTCSTSAAAGWRAHVSREKRLEQREKRMEQGEGQRRREPSSAGRKGMDWREWGRLALVAAIGVLAWPSAGFAPTALTGGVNGRVKDATGAALPGANVSIASASVGVTREATTDAQGSFSILLDRLQGAHPTGAVP